MDKRAAFISLRVTKGFTALISILSSPSELKLGQVTSKPARKSVFFLLVLPWGTRLRMKVLERGEGDCLQVYLYDAARHQFNLIYSEITAPRSIHSIRHA